MIMIHSKIISVLLGMIFTTITNYELFTSDYVGRGGVEQEKLVLIYSPLRNHVISVFDP